METIQVKIDVQVDYTGCKSKQERAQVRVDAKHKARQQVKAAPVMLKAIQTFIRGRATCPTTNGKDLEAWELMQTAIAKI